MATSKVKNVSVSRQCPPNLNKPNNPVKWSGRSSTTWVFKGVYLSGEKECVVVLEAGESFNSSTCKVDRERDGGIFSAGADGTFCELTLESSNLDIWSVLAETDKDVKAGEGMVFQAEAGAGVQL